MAIQIDPITEVTRNTPFSVTVTASGTAGETVDLVEVAFESEVYEGVSIVGATISGSYESLFQDITRSVSSGSSDRLEEPLVTNNVDDLPEGRDLYQYRQDTAPTRTASYTVTTTYTPMGGGDQQQDVQTVNHTVNNSTTFGLNWLLNYLGL
jgi:hypothetical protein